MEILPSYSDEDLSFLMNSFYYLDTDSDSNQPQPARGEESLTHLWQLASIEKDLLKLAYDQRTVFNEETYQTLLDLRKQKDAIQNHFSLHTFSPYVNLFFNIANTAKEKNYSNLEFLESLKTGMSETSFKKEIQQKKKAISKNKQSLLRYIESLFEYRSRLLILRMDFSYQQDGGGFFRTLDNKKIDLLFGTTSKELLEEWSIEVRAQRNLLLKNLKKKYKKDLVGYVWKLEYGAEKAFHYHMMFFLDESNHRQDIKIAESIGEMWKHEITQGKGIYWNCNAKKKNYEKNGRVATGKIKHDDHELRENLNIMASYLTKPDYFVRLTLPNGVRTFGKGSSPKKIKSGRPRN